MFIGWTKEAKNITSIDLCIDYLFLFIAKNINVKIKYVGMVGVLKRATYIYVSRYSIILRSLSTISFLVVRRSIMVPI